jgi:outer membrane autotransporter protein
LYGIWGEGYGDYARLDKLSPGNQSVSFTSYGVLSGLDHTYLRSPREGILLGGFAGYNETKGEFSGSANTEAKSQDVQGTMLGLYTSYFRGGFAIDLVAKSDLFNLDQVGLNSDCGNPGTGSVGFVNYVIATNAYYRRDLGNQIWFEPMIGLRLVQTHFASGAGALGLEDGNSLRLEGGARVGSDWVDPDHRLWSLSFLAAIYSDVTVNGYTASGADVLDQDAGAIRVLGQLRAKVTTVNGFSYYGQAEVRVGENYLGVGGKVGLRYDW